MPTNPGRRFTLADAMVLVAATAAGMALCRMWYPPGPYDVSEGIFMSSWRLRPIVTTCFHIVKYWPIVAMWTLALTALRLRRPRPIGRRLFAPPGLAACAGADAVMILQAAIHTPGVLLYNWSLKSWNVTDVRAIHVSEPVLEACASTAVGFGVAAVWVSMALARRWRPEPTWIDRAGRFVGLLWLLLIPIRVPLDIWTP